MSLETGTLYFGLSKHQEVGSTPLTKVKKTFAKKKNNKCLKAPWRRQRRRPKQKGGDDSGRKKMSGATICIGLEIRCHPYGVFFLSWPQSPKSISRTSMYKTHILDTH